MSQVYKSLQSGPVPPDVATTFTTDDGDAIPALNTLNVLGGTGISTSGVGNTITINSITGGFNWIESSIDIEIDDQTGIFCNSLLTVTLPPTVDIEIGSTVIIYVDTSFVVTVQANVGQFLQVGNDISISAGTTASTAQGNMLQLVFKPSDNTWHTISSMGVWNTETS